MSEEFQVRAPDGKLIAAIHDPEAFAELLSRLEEHAAVYSRERQGLLTSMMLPNNQQDQRQFEEAAQALRDLHVQLGDSREGLYPTDTRTVIGVDKYLARQKDSS